MQVVGKVVGFDGLGAKDDFETSALEDRMFEAEVSPLAAMEVVILGLYRHNTHLVIAPD
jgi:hypothetical protein